MMYQDKTLVCRDCGAEFVFTAGEQEFYAEKGFQNEPTRCKDCRAARKASRANAPRESYETVCRLRQAHHGSLRAQERSAHLLQRVLRRPSSRLKNRTALLRKGPFPSLSKQGKRKRSAPDFGSGLLIVHL